MSAWHSKPITSTGFDSQICGEDGYEIHFYTDRKEAYLAVQDVCRRFIDHKLPRRADRIRAMTDEELADIFDLLTRTKPETKDDKKIWLDWLKQDWIN